MKEFSKFLIATILGLALIGVGLDIHDSRLAHAAPIQGSIPVCDQFKSISLAADSIVITPSAGNFVYICNLGLVAGTADNFSVVEGTGALCVTNALAMLGGSTAATGMNMAANGVFTYGSGTGAVLKTAVPGDSVCILRSSAGPLSGGISWTAANF